MSLFSEISADHERLVKAAREVEEEMPRVVAIVNQLRSLSAKISAHNAAECLLLDPVLRANFAVLDLPTVAETTLYSQCSPAALAEMTRIVDDFGRFAAAFPGFVDGLEKTQAREEKMWPALSRALRLGGGAALLLRAALSAAAGCGLSHILWRPLPGCLMALA
jgi:hypothetical protein